MWMVLQVTVTDVVGRRISHLSIGSFPDKTSN